jgi:uncharacterized protein (TIGR02391 family)
MAIAISSLVPSVLDLLALEVEELAGVLLVHLNSYRQGDSEVVQHGKISPGNLLGAWHRSPGYDGERKEEVKRALMEAWAWLESEAFLVESEPGSHWFFVSRRGQQLLSREDVAAYRQANALPRHNLHPIIASRVYPAYLRGEYDTAVFQAFREVEVAVRVASDFPATMLGVPLMRAAFRPPNDKTAAGPLTDAQLPGGEQEAMVSLFAGVLGLYKNPHSHRHIPTGPIDAAEVIGLASQLTLVP